MHQVQRRFKCTGNIIFFVSVSIRAYLLVSVTIFYSGYRQIETLVYISKILIVRVSRTCLNFTIAMNYFIELNLSSPNILCPPMWNLLIGYAYTLCWMIVYFMFCRKIWYWSILVNATFTNVCCLIGVCVCVRKREGAEREREREMGWAGESAKILITRKMSITLHIYRSVAVQESHLSTTFQRSATLLGIYHIYLYIIIISRRWEQKKN